MDIVFLSETHCNVKALPKYPGFTALGDPSFPLFQRHGGLAVYIKDTYSQFVKDLRFSRCTISFNLNIFPKICFMGVYVYPIDSINYDAKDFGIVTEEICVWTSQGYTPYIGGDFNSRLGNINDISMKSLGWRYEENVDTFKGQNCSKFSDMCVLSQILPLNHCRYYQKCFEGHWTYFKGNKKSQIDFILTDKNGRKYITSFEIVKVGWHISDHLPIDMKIKIAQDINIMEVLIRAKSLMDEFSYSHNSKHIKCFKQKFNETKSSTQLTGYGDSIILECQNKSVDEMLDILYRYTDIVLNENSCKQVVKKNIVNLEDVKECDRRFKRYLSTVNNIECNEACIRDAYSNYQQSRNLLNLNLLKKCTNEYKQAIETHDDKRLWKMIDWSGNANFSAPKTHPSIKELAEYFTTLYEPIDNDGNLQDLKSDVSIPVTDDEISSEELRKAAQQMKKGGYDYPTSVLRLLTSTLMIPLLFLFNNILFNNYPKKFCIALMSVIPKIGNLSLPTNYRGIQMQPLLANLYDRILANRLIQWVKISDEQTAFQKGKGTLDQIFILRIIIALIKYKKLTLYIGFFDLSKAFDRVSRYLLLKALVKMGVGTIMLNALKCMYSSTRCILKGFGKISNIFETYTGIKQGASSSVILFIAFLDDIIDTLKEKCDPEPILNDLHCLLHADDTLVLSTKRELFVTKCNILLEELHKKKMSLNFKKSVFMIINGCYMDTKCALKLKNTWLNYTNQHRYLGIIISDSGEIKADVSAFIDEKNKQINVKLANFMSKNLHAPVMVKLKVVKACVNSTLTYGCESWGNCPLNKVEVQQRKSLKIALDVKNSVPNEIIYIESGFKELKSMIYRRQLKFFRKYKQDALDNPTSSICSIFRQAIDVNIPYIRHYKQLDQNFTDPDECCQFYIQKFDASITCKIKLKHESDSNSILGTYFKINPLLNSPQMYQSMSCMESERSIITKYRTGSHQLRIQSGRLHHEQQSDRLCKCETEVQTIEHMVFRCPRTENSRRIHNYTHLDLQSFFEGKDYITIAAILKSFEKI